MFLNTIKGALSVLFPVITFPYLSKVLGVNNIGLYNFANSIISYFILLAGLGISTYAMREGANYREKTCVINRFSCEIFTINIISTIFSYLLFFLFLWIFDVFYDYRLILLILSLQIVFKTIGVEWVYSVYEDYRFITVVSVFFQILTVILIFLFVNNENDVYKYAFITIFSVIVSNIIYFIYARKYCSIKITKKINLKSHFKPILILFATAVTITVSVNSDTTILGFLCGDYTVGIYSVSVKVCGIVKIFISSILMVSIPRFSNFYWEKKYENFNNTATDVFSILLTFVVPLIFFIASFRKEIILIISDASYLDAATSLYILSFSLFFCMGAWFWGQCILVPLKKEKSVFYITVASAFINITLNFLLIPFWNENAAALTTVISESLAFFCCWFYGRKFVRIKNIFQTLIKVLFGCSGIVFISKISEKYCENSMLLICFTMFFSGVLYLCIEILIKNESIWSFFTALKKHKQF